MNFIFMNLQQSACDIQLILLVCCVIKLTSIGIKMKKTLLLIIIAIVLASCGNKKPAQVSDNSDNKLICTTKKKMGSNMPVKTCRTVAEQKQERKDNQESIRETRTAN